MKNGIINIKAFRLLDAIRDKHNLLDKDWAKASTLGHGARISELRAMANDTRSVADRAFHYKKWIALLRGLETILGGNIVKKELADLLEKSTDPKERLILIASEVPEDRLEDAFNYLQLLIQAPPKTPKK
jgi:hypothetical protein